MNKFLVTALCVVGIATASVSFAQKEKPSKKGCASHENYERMLVEDPNFKANSAKIEQRTSGLVSNGLVAGLAATTTVRIPVVVHVIYNTAQQNISVAQIQSQISVLNKDFRKLNADVSQTPALFSALTADTNVEFYLATTTPTGAATTGITRKSTTKTSWGTRDAMKSSKKGGVDAWNTSKYLNLWVCEIGGGILGYAQFPGGAATTDGVVIAANYFGSSDFGTGFFLAAPYDKGRTATHEVGHWLNLRHIWGDATCGNDQVSDTPVAQTSNFGCPTYPRVGSCGTTEMTMNYMDYTDDRCMYMFTTGQKTRMRALFEPGGARAGLATGLTFARDENNVSALSSNSFLEVYPNPASGAATVRVSFANVSNSVEISVTDILGRVVYSYEDRALSANSVEHQLDLSNFKHGMYFINVVGDNYKEVKRLLVK